jgi:hypothetical protein
MGVTAGSGAGAGSGEGAGLAVVVGVAYEEPPQPVSSQQAVPQPSVAQHSVRQRRHWSIARISAKRSRTGVHRGRHTDSQPLSQPTSQPALQPVSQATPHSILHDRLANQGMRQGFSQAAGSQHAVGAQHFAGAHALQPVSQGPQAPLSSPSSRIISSPPNPWLPNAMLNTSDPKTVVALITSNSFV